LLSIVIPTFNEEKRILPTLEALTKFLGEFPRGRREYEILVVDDGSDATAEIVRGFSKNNRRVRLIRFARRIGKGAAVKRGLSAARGSEIVVYDADAAAPPSEIPKLVRALRAYDVAVGVRRESVGPLRRRLIRKAYNFLVRFLFGWRFRDTQCGFKALRAAAAKKIAGELRRGGYEFDVELLARARKHGFSIVEIPVEWRHVPGGPIDSASFSESLAAAARMIFGTVLVRLEA